MIRCASLTLLLSLLSSQVSAQEPPDYVKEYAKKSHIQRFQAIADAKRHVSAIRDHAQRAIQLGQPKREAMTYVQDAVERVNEYAAKLADPLEPFYGAMDSQSLKTGSIGCLNWIDASVFQVIDDENMLVELAWLAPVTKYLNSSEAATEENVYEGVERRTLLVWVRGVETSGLTDRKGLAFQGVQPAGIFAVRETETYPTHAGSRTVPVLEEIDMSPWARLFTMRGEMREWKDKSGKHSVQAAFVDYKGGKVELIGDNGKRSKLNLSDLSKPDQSYVREQMSARRKMLSAARG
jgi:hypothetical protein